MDKKPQFTTEEISVGKAREYLSVLNLTLPDIGEQTIILNNVRASSDIVVSSCEYFCMIRCRGTPVDAKVYTIQPQQLALSTMNPNDVPFTIDPKVVIVESSKNTLIANASSMLSMSFETLQSFVTETIEFHSEISEVEKSAHVLLDTLSRYFVKQKLTKQYAWCGVEDDDELLPYADFIKVVDYAGTIFQSEPPMLRLDSPIYVFGDIHGNYNDLIRFSKMLGMYRATHVVPSKFLFLGDYVDRGRFSIEVVAYLFAMKVLYPNRIFLLKGNHEIGMINSCYKAYGRMCLHGSCSAMFGAEVGKDVWNHIQRAFDNLPICAAVDEKIFCAHGGLPRILSINPEIDIISKIMSIKRPWSLDFPEKLQECLADEENQMVFDILWADPAPKGSILGKDGFPPNFGPNKRGPGSCVFGREVIQDFYAKTGFTHIIRAHEAVHFGIDLKNSGTLLTVFSSSGYKASNNAAAVFINHRK